MKKHRTGTHPEAAPTSAASTESRQSAAPDSAQSSLQPNTTPEEKPAGRTYTVFDGGPLTCKTDIEGLEFDFNYGARVKVPKGDWRVRILDRDMGVTLYDAKASEAIVTSTKKFYVNFRIEIYKDEKRILAHDMDLRGKKVHIKFPVGTLGDTIAWFPYAEVFGRTHACEIYCSMAPELADLFRPSCPDIHFIEPETRPEDTYATYYMGIFFPCDDRNHQPIDWRIAGLHKTIAYILGLPVQELRPQIVPDRKERDIAEPYVCIAAQSTTQCKYWNNPDGWLQTIQYLKDLGYRVLCIDKNQSHGAGSRWNTIPYGAEDFTGDRPLKERVRLLYHADFFVGLGSGLSWLAWAVGKPVVLISGFSLPHTEFYTPYRAINYHVCNGCFNEEEFVHDDFDWCPRHKHTDRQYECTRFITSSCVNSLIDRLISDHKLHPKRR